MAGTEEHDEPETPVSKKGIATPKQDVDLIKQRYAEAKERAEHEE